MTNSNQTHSGIILKQARESRGITLETVHEATKIPLDALRAIEEGYNVRILSSFYYKGFVKMYAQYLNIPSETVVDEEEIKARPMVSTTLYPSIIRKNLNNVSPLRGFKESDLKRRFSDLLTRRQKQQIVIGLGVLLALFIAVKVFAFVRNRFTPRTTQTQRMAAERKAKSKVTEKNKTGDVSRRTEVAKLAAAPKIVNPSSTPTETPKVSSPAMVKATENISLTVRAKKNSWLQVRADGVVVFQSTLNKGAVENWTANDKIEISGKNINDLEFEINGKLISSLGKSERQARRLIVTKEGLTIKN